MYVPLFHRLRFSEWLTLVVSLFFIYVETLITYITAIIPTSVINVIDSAIKFFYRPLEKQEQFKSLNDLPSIPDFEKVANSLQNATGFKELCDIFEYESESHLIKTDDDYILTVHRIVGKKNRIKNENSKKPVVYFHHGLLMNSEMWITMMKQNENLPFLLSDLGYDVWLGNNRGNKYCQKHLKLKPEDWKFWDFSIDEFAVFDIPNIINTILSITQVSKLIYIGFSQGSAQCFASLSINTELNDKIEKFIALSPAMTPNDLHNSVINTLMKSTPTLMFLIFGRKVLLSSATFWLSIIYRPLFVRIIDFCNTLLFNWTGDNINYNQKLISYSHLYSATSVKVVVHWFQIIRNKTFQMYDDSISISQNKKLISDYQIANYPSLNIKVPILLVYGKSDSLVNIEFFLNQLPNENVKIIGIDNHEHLEIVWSNKVEEEIFPLVVNYIVNERNDTLQENYNDPKKRLQSSNAFLTITRSALPTTTPVTNVITAANSPLLLLSSDKNFRKASALSVNSNDKSISFAPMTKTELNMEKVSLNNTNATAVIRDADEDISTELVNAEKDPNLRYAESIMKNIIQA